MNDEDHLHILWTNADPVTAETMVFMYAGNAVKRGWWTQVTVVVWGATAMLVSADGAVRARIAELREQGVGFSACKACADELGVTAELEQLGIEVVYWGEPLTRLLRGRAPLLTV